MAQDQIDILKSTSHDFLSPENNFITYLIGFAPAKSRGYLIYRLFLFLVLITVTTLIIYGLVLVPSKTLIFDSIHYLVLAFNGLSILTTRILARRSLFRARSIVQSGIYHYKNEQVDEEENELKEGITPEFKRKFNFFLTCQIFGFVSNQIIFPITQLSYAGEEHYDSEHEFINPFLPHFFFVPFNTRSFLGYLATYLFDSACYFYMYSASLCMLLVYISCTVQIKTHLQVLRHSLKNVHRRAFNEYIRRGQHVEPGTLLEDLFENKEFQLCLNSCLRSNAEHHEAVIRLLKESQPFLGVSLMYAFSVCSVFYASLLYLISQKPQMNLLINYLLTFVAESVYLYQLCVFGDEVIQESKNLFRTLYNIPWFNYGKSFNKTLHIMMTNSKTPLQYKATLIRWPASFDTYGSVISGMYKVVSLARQSDVLT